MANPAKTVVAITGVTGALGYALAREFARFDQVVLCGCGTSNSSIHNLKRELGAPHHFVVARSSSSTQIRAWGVHVLSNFGPPDFLVNLAVHTVEAKPVWEYAEADIDLLIDQNVKGSLNAIRSFLPAMLLRKRGVIVNVVFSRGVKTGPYGGPTGACNAAIEQLTLALAKELPAKMGSVLYRADNVEASSTFKYSDTRAGSLLPETWAAKFAPALLKLSSRDNGKSLSLTT